MMGRTDLRLFPSLKSFLRNHHSLGRVHLLKKSIAMPVRFCAELAQGKPDHVTAMATLTGNFNG